jgi:hypothetical protein
VHKRGFAGPVLANKCVNFPTTDLEAHVIDGSHTRKRLDDISNGKAGGCGRRHSITPLHRLFDSSCHHSDLDKIFARDVKELGALTEMQMEIVLVALLFEPSGSDGNWAGSKRFMINLDHRQAHEVQIYNYDRSDHTI